jgi:hypothetical protein
MLLFIMELGKFWDANRTVNWPIFTKWKYKYSRKTKVVLHFHAGTYSLWSDWHPKKNKSQIETGGKKEIQEKWNKCEF